MPNFNRPFLIRKTLSKKAKIFALIFLCLLVVALLALSLLPIVLIFSTTKPQNPSYFAVMLDSQQTSKTDASEQAQSFKARGGAGVLFFDKTYFVVMSAYKTESEAKKVAKNLSSETQNFVVKKFELNFDEKAETSKRYKTFLQNLLDELYSISVKLDDKTLTPVLANQNLRNLLTKTNLMFEDTLKSNNLFFEDIFLNAKSILEYATSIDVMSTTLLPYSSVLRQAQIQILILSSKKT